MAYYTQSAKEFRFPELPNNKPKVKKAFTDGFLKAGRNSDLSDQQITQLWLWAQNKQAQDTGKTS